MATCFASFHHSTFILNPIVSATSVISGRSPKWTGFPRNAISFPTGWTSVLWKEYDLAEVAAEQQQRRRWRDADRNEMMAKCFGVDDSLGEIPSVGFDVSRLEAYTERARLEVLCVNALVDDEEDQVIVFKGFSSSLMRETPDDPSEPILPSTAVIVSIDRMRGPFNPSKPQYIQQGMSWQEFEQVLKNVGL